MVSIMMVRGQYLDVIISVSVWSVLFPFYPIIFFLFFMPKLEHATIVPYS